MGAALAVGGALASAAVIVGLALLMAWIAEEGF